MTYTSTTLTGIAFCIDILHSYQNKLGTCPLNSSVVLSMFLDQNSKPLIVILVIP